MIPVFAPPFIPAGDWWYSGSEVDLDFTNARYHDDNAPTTDLTSATVLMLHCDGADASTNFSDSTGRHFVVPRNSAQIDTAQSKFGGASLLTTSATSDAVQIADGISDFDFGTGDFTIDLWIRLNAGGTYQNIFDMHPTEGGPNIYQELFVFTENTLVYRSNGAARITGTTALSTGVWYHVAVARSSGNTKMFLGGVQEGSTYADTNDYEAGLLTIGATASNLHQNVNGWIDEFRVLKGVAAWTANFTPPTAPYDVGVGPYDLLSCSRASIGYAQTVAGALTQFASNALRITDLGLLVEDTRTNLQIQSQNFSGYALENVTLGSTTNTAPDGTSTATKVIEDSGSVAHDVSQAISLSAAIYTWSIYAKADGRGFAFLQACADASNRYALIVNLSTGATSNNTLGSVSNAASAVETLGNGWYRLQVTITATASAYIVFGLSDSLSPTLNANNYPVYNGDGSSGVQFWGAQVEAGAFASSYIPTTTATAARAVDVVTCIGSLESTLAGSAASVVINQITLFLASSDSYSILKSTSPAFNFPVWFPGNAQGTIRTTDPTPDELFATLGNSLTLDDGAKVGLAYNASGRSIVGAGGTVESDATTINGSTYSLGGPHSGTGYWFGYFRRLTAWASRLADATLQGLTAP